MSDEDNKPADSANPEAEANDLETENDESDPLSAIRELRLKLEKADKDYMYLRADFDNFKKASIKERGQLVKYGNERLLVELLSVIDNFDHALDSEFTADNWQSFREGVEMIRKELFSTLSRFGLEKLDSKGECFDPNLHEALSSEPTEKIPPGHISQVFKEAYKLHDRIIRPAQVVVAQEPDNKVQE